MYKVTSEQWEIAVAVQHDVFVDNSHFQERKLPLISFPWVLQPILGRIANESFENPVTRRGCSAHIQVEIPRGSKPRKIMASVLPPDVETSDGVKHAGNVLQLFEDSKQDPIDRLCIMFDETASSVHQTENITPPFNGTKGEITDLFFEVNDDVSTPSISLPYPNIQGKITIPAQEPIIQHITSPALSTRSNGLDIGSRPQKYFANPTLPATQREAHALKLGDAHVKNLHIAEAAGDLALVAGSQEEGQEEEIIDFGNNLQPSALDELMQLIGMD
ncbi:RNA-directed RNA polymerase [Histoplasma ohiense]|nr:RNA-directed RNA polymerase [Histoplasma ohiense (nom. inval.)]